MTTFSPMFVYITITIVMLIGIIDIIRKVIHIGVVMSTQIPTIKNNDPRHIKASDSRMMSSRITKVNKKVFKHVRQIDLALRLNHSITTVLSFFSCLSIIIIDSILILFIGVLGFWGFGV